MAVFTTNDRYARRYDGSNWQEEVLSASGVKVDDSVLTSISGDTVQELFGATDNVLTGIDYSTASGIVPIDEVTNVSGTTGASLGDLAVLTMPSGSDSIIKFSFSIGAQPASTPHIRVLYSPVTSGASGNFKLDLDYNLFDQSDNLNPGSFLQTSQTNTDSIVSGDYNEMKLATLTLPLADFSSGSAPFIASCQLTRDVSVSGNYAGNIAIVALYADNIPGAVQGNTAGYIGGNLTVDGNLVVEGTAILQGGTVPASGTATGTSGSLVINNDWVYFCVSTNQWKRSPISNF